MPPIPSYYSHINSSNPMSSKLFALLLLFLALSPAVGAQKSPPGPAVNSYNPYNTSVSPALAILVVAIVCAFMLLAFFSIYIRRCASQNPAVSPVTIAGTTGRQLGLDSSLLEKFPTMVYSSVKERKLGKESLECAICLCGFEDDDVIRLLPKCSHVYHRDCVDVWFGAHVTCPVCRSNLASGEENSRSGSEDRDPELDDLVRIGSERREARSGSAKRIAAAISGSSGGSGGGGGERFTLRLPEEVRREIVGPAGLRRSASFAVFVRRGYRRSGRWAILGRSFSARNPVAGPGGEKAFNLV